MVNPQSADICAEPLDYPPPICTRPPGHGGAHASEIIPEPLAAAAANAVRAADELDAETARMLDAREGWIRRTRFNARISVVLIGLAAVNGLIAFVSLLYWFT